MNGREIIPYMQAVSQKMREECSYLCQLDARNGDGDLGLTMQNGFAAAAAAMESWEGEDLGELFLAASKAFNAAAPSTLGTILSFGLMGMAKALRKQKEVTLEQMAAAMAAGIRMIMEKGGAKPGDKTILDALCPAVAALQSAATSGGTNAWRAAYLAAEQGAESTRDMLSKHGRAAYYGEKSIGLVDGGAIAGKFIFSAIWNIQCACKAE